MALFREMVKHTRRPSLSIDVIQSLRVPHKKCCATYWTRNMVTIFTILFSPFFQLRPHVFACVVEWRATISVHKFNFEKCQTAKPPLIGANLQWYDRPTATKTTTTTTTMMAPKPMWKVFPGKLKKNPITYFIQCYGDVLPEPNRTEPYSDQHRTQAMCRHLHLDFCCFL